MFAKNTFGLQIRNKLGLFGKGVFFKKDAMSWIYKNPQRYLHNYSIIENLELFVFPLSLYCTVHSPCIT